MIPQRVTLENFLCFGGQQVIEFTDDEPLWVLGGPNGVGKSAVFDAMTFCLFGQHRGAANAVTPLQRHGASGFAVSFEFGLRGTDYRIARNRTGNRSTQSVESRVAGQAAWVRVPNVETADQITVWSQLTLGIGFEAFRASIMLRQGEANAIIAAPPAKRLEVLKKVIGAERFEQLSARVHAASVRAKAAKADAVAERDGIPLVTPETLAIAEGGAATTAAERELCESARGDAGAAVEQADRWVALAGKRAEVQGKLDAAHARAADAGPIRVGHARHAELSRTLPTLAKLPELRAYAATLSASTAGLGAACAADESRHGDLAARLDSNRTAATLLCEAVTRHGVAGKESRRLGDEQSKFHGYAVDCEKLTAELTGFPAGLDETLSRYEGDVTAADAAERVARQTATEARTLLTHSRATADDFARLKIGVSCSQCGQLVDADHADRERARLAAKIDDLTRLGVIAAEALDSAKSDLSTASAGRKHVAGQCASRDKVRRDATAKRDTLANFGCTLTAAELAASIAGHAATASDAERDGATATREHTELSRTVGALTAELTGLRQRLAEATPRLAAETQTLHGVEVRLAALLDHLPVGTHAVTAAEVAGLRGELAALTTARVVELFALLQADDALRDEWRRQVADLDREVEAIPPAGRVTVADARRRLADAHATLAAADGRWQSARDLSHERRRQFQTHRELTARIKTLEEHADRHDKLDRHLGKNGLQRHLVRTAEKAIVALATETLGKLSHGDLSVELDEGEAADDKAFVLRVRRAGGETIAVEYLSGSQKFRVAISVALAIGRYATNQSHPLECVIIDEGFGSLDKEGLRATAEELNLLKLHLKRIILVSHQDEFTDQFPVVIQLTAGENGTTAKPVRR